MGMTPRNTKIAKDTDDTSFELLNYKVDELQKGFIRMEAKIDNASYVHTGDYALNRQDDAKRYATKEDVRVLQRELRPFKRFAATAAVATTTVLIGIVVAWISQGGLKHG